MPDLDSVLVDTVPVGAMPVDGIPVGVAPPVDPFRPSEYSGLLMQALRSRADTFARGAGLDMGMGSGVLLATLGLLGIERLVGVDIDPAAISASSEMARSLGLLGRTRLLQGSLWEPLGDETFDVVVTNLPNFAATEPSDPDHSRFWSMGGADGRRVIDPFLAGLRRHLNPGGVAFMTHNVFAGLAETAAILAGQGLSARPILATTTLLHPMKSTLMSPVVRAKYDGSAMRRLGPYEFADVQVLEIRAASQA
jgi:methylase of polypeptide subunit release factors